VHGSQKSKNLRTKPKCNGQCAPAHRNRLIVSVARHRHNAVKDCFQKTVCLQPAKSELSVKQSVEWIDRHTRRMSASFLGRHQSPTDSTIAAHEAHLAVKAVNRRGWRNRKLCWCAFLSRGAHLHTKRPDLPIPASMVDSAQHFIRTLRDNSKQSFPVECRSLTRRRCKKYQPLGVSGTPRGRRVGAVAPTVSSPSITSVTGLDSRWVRSIVVPSTESVIIFASTRPVTP